MLIMAVPIGAVGVLSGERVHGSRLGWIQDAGWRRVIKHDAIHVLVQLGHLQLEILDGEVDVGTPRLELCSRRSERILQRLENFIFGEFYIWGGSLPPPAGRQAPAANWRGGRGPAGGRQALSKDLCAKQIYFYLHIGPYSLSAGR